MVENDKEYVLQWAGHAAHVTERFSGLLARQALVDVTLICQGQKLRVHKLVLASCSLYFEEMLEQDLGQEPIILLRDLDFDVLKAMVEFMYCGETTLSHCHLQTLYDAAQVFKVKELECIVNSMLETERENANASHKIEDSEFAISSTSDRKNKIPKSRPSGERCQERSPSSETEESTISLSKTDQILDINVRINYCDNDDENSLYETIEMVNAAICSKEESESSYQSSVETLDCSDSEASKMCTSDDDEETTQTTNESSNPSSENVLKSLFSERRCNYLEETELQENPESHTINYDVQDLSSAVGECSKVYIHKKRKFANSDESSEENLSDSASSSRNDDEILTDYSADCSDAGSSRVEKGLKVYTHKRRKSLSDKKSSYTEDINDKSKEPPSTYCIDLSEDPTMNNQPVTLPSTLDMETSEYIWSLSSESIQYVVGCTINPSCQLIPVKETSKVVDDLDNVVLTSTDKSVRKIKELFSVENGNLDNTKRPVLRRSMRINQLENDDSINNNNGQKRETRRYDFGNSINVTGKAKRKVNKDSYCVAISDENNVTTSQSLRKNTNSRSLRSTSKIENVKNTGKSRCNERHEKSKNNGKGKGEKREKAESTDCDFLLPTRLNTIASVDRALWGDMSDVMENRENGVTLITDYSPSKEIPFAVGLLPLRAALERMQATLDHQPRKTRSSVAPLRQEFNGFRRKNTNFGDSPNGGKKQMNDVVGNTVCHIEISTADECSENRRNSSNEDIVGLGLRNDRR